MNLTPLRDLLAAWTKAREADPPDPVAVGEATNAVLDCAKRCKTDLDRADAITEVAALADGTDAQGLKDALKKLASYPMIEPPPKPVPPVELVPLDTVDDAKPRRVIWRKGKAGSWLARGEVAVLSGAGGGGKSTLALQWALAAARNELHGTDQGAETGCRVAAGQVVYLSWEDRRRRIKDRADKITKDWSDDPSHLVHVAEGNGPIFGPPPDHPLFNARPVPLPNWDDLWKQVRLVHNLSLVVLDPVTSAFAGDASRVEAVRLFLDELRAEAEAADCGILLIAHSTKAGRAGTDETGAVAGSAAWADAARGVVTLSRPPRKKPDSESPDVLACTKSNYGPPWDLHLTPCPSRQDFARWKAGGDDVEPEPEENQTQHSNNRQNGAGTHTRVRGTG